MEMNVPGRVISTLNLNASLMMLAGAAMAGTLALVGRATTGVNGLLIIGLAGLIAIPIHAMFIKPILLKAHLRNRKFVKHCIIGGAITGFGYGLFALGIQGNINPYTATILFELNIFSTMFFASLFVRKIAFSGMQYVWLMLTFVGVLLLATDRQLGSATFSFNFSAVLILTSIIMMGLGSGLIQRGMRLIDSTFHVGVTAGLLGRIGGLIFTLPIGIYLNAGLSLDLFSLELVFWIFVCGIFTIGISNLLYYGAANVSQTHLVNNFWAMIPVFGLIYLAIAGYVGFSPQIGLGAGFILASNLLISVETRTRLSYVMSILAVVISGTIIFFYDGFGDVDFFGAVSTSVIFFILVFTIAISREERALDRELQCIADILADTMKHKKFRSSIIKFLDPSTSYIDAIHLNDIEKLPGQTISRLSELRLLRGTGASIPEVFVLFVTGLLSCAVMLGFRPSGFIYDSFSLVVVTSVIFLMFFVIEARTMRTNLNHNFQNLISSQGANEGVLTLDILSVEARWKRRFFALTLMSLLMLFFIILFLGKHHDLGVYFNIGS